MPPLQPIPSPRASGNADADRLPPYDDESDYMAQMKSFLVPELESPEVSCPCSVPSRTIDGALAESAEMLRREVETAHNQDGQKEEESSQRLAIEPRTEDSLPEELIENTCSMLKSNSCVVGPDDRSCVLQVLHTHDGASSKEQSSHEDLNLVENELLICRPAQSQHEPTAEGTPEPVEESQSTVLTADLVQLLDMSTTDSISSPLLTPATYRGRSGGAGHGLRKSSCGGKTISPTLAPTEPALPESVLQTSPLNVGSVTEAKICSGIAHSTPIASVQVSRSEQASDTSCRAHSRIPSSIKRSQLKHIDDDPKSSGEQNAFSFSELVPQAVSTPTGFGPHQMWGMGDVACTAPQLQLSDAAAAERQLCPDSQNSERSTTSSVKNIETAAAPGSLPADFAICALTPVATQANVACPDVGMVPEQCNKQQGVQPAIASSRPPTHPTSQLRAKATTRIPSCQNIKRRNQVSQAGSVGPSTPAIVPIKPQPSDESLTGHVKLILGSGEPACLSNPSPSAAPEVLLAKETLANEVPMIGTPPYNKLMKFLRNPNPAAADPTSAVAQASSLQDDEVSPVMQSDQVALTTTSALPGSAKIPVFRQLIQNIQAEQYRSPAVNFSAFAEIERGGDPYTDGLAQPEERSSSKRSEVGENDIESETNAAEVLSGNITAVADVTDSVTDDVCCSRVSDMCPDNDVSSERSIHMEGAAHIAVRAFGDESPVTSSRPSSKFGLLTSSASLAAVVVSVTECDDGSGHVQLCLDVPNETEHTSGESATPMIFSSQDEAPWSGHASEERGLGDSAHGLAVDICDDIAISCTVNIGGLSPGRHGDTTDVTSVSAAVDAGKRDAVSFGEADGSPAHSVSIAGDLDFFSPPQLCTSPHANCLSVDATGSAQQDGLHSPIKSLSPDHAAMVHGLPGQQSPVVAHIEMVKEMIRSGQLPKPSEDQVTHGTGLPEVLDTPKCSQMVTDIQGSFKAPASEAPGSALFMQWLEANGIRSQVKPGGTPYCVIGDLWKRQQETDEEFQGFKTMELENAAKTEQEHADDIRKLQDEKAEMATRVMEAEQRAHLLAEELDCVRQELASAQQQLLCMKSNISKVPDDDRLPTPASAAPDSVEQRPLSDWQSTTTEDRIEEVVDEVKGLEELIVSVCRRSCTQNNSHADFVQIYSYFHQLKVRLQSGRFRMTQRAESSIDTVKAFVTWAKPSIAELCTCYDTTAREVTRRSVDIARMRKMGNFADGAMLKNQAENSDLHQHLEGVSVSMRWHVYEVFSQLHKIGQTLMVAVKNGQNGVIDSESASVVSQVKDDVLPEEDDSPQKRDFTEPLSLMLGKRAKAIQGQLESMSLASHNQHLQPPMQAEATDADLQGQVGVLDSMDTPVNEGVHRGTQDFCLTSPPQIPVVPRSTGVDTCHPVIKLLGTVLDKENPLFNSSPDPVDASSSDAPTSFAPAGSDSAEHPSIGSPEALLMSDQNQQSVRVHDCASGQDENSPHLRTQSRHAKAATQYPSKDRIEFICHALNMGISPFARRHQES